MTETDKLKNKIMEEFLLLGEEKNIEFTDEINFPREIFAAKSINELEEIRSNMYYNSCLALLSLCEEIINYYSKLFEDTTTYNNELSYYAEEIDKINSRKKFDKDYLEYKKIFDKLWSLNRKLKQNKNNFEKQSKWKFITKIAPIWFSIISVFYVAIIGNLINSGKINFSYYLIFWWGVLLIIVLGMLKLIIYPFKSPFKIKKKS